jgi:hypothetical protein
MIKKALKISLRHEGLTRVSKRQVSRFVRMNLSILALIDINRQGSRMYPRQGEYV